MQTKVLIVDDDEGNLFLLQALFASNERYHILTAQDGPAAVEIAAREKPAIVLLDVLLPGMDGFEVCKAIRSNPDTAHARVLLLTGMTQDRDKAQGLSAGADGFLTKPYSPTDLLKLLEGWFAEDPPAGDCQGSRGEACGNGAETAKERGGAAAR
ncbi:MAG: response regulator [Chloroflexi bacterium]|nr:response regulator [Chloroflexota bacterium]